MAAFQIRVALMELSNAKGVGELGIYGVAAAAVNTIYNATGVREYPVHAGQVTGPNAYTGLKG